MPKKRFDRGVRWRPPAIVFVSTAALLISGQLVAAKPGGGGKFGCAISPTSPTLSAGESVTFSGGATGGKTPYTYSWDLPGGSPSSAGNVSSVDVTYGSASGSPYTATFTVEDGNKRPKTCSASATVTVQGPPDTISPTVSSISATPSGPTYTAPDTVTISAVATDNVGVDRVEFYDGANLMATDSTEPYSHDWAITSTDNGSHAWTARAYDAAGNTGTSDPLALTVDIQAANIPPTADANGPYTGIAGVAVSFSSAGSSDQDGTIASYSWDFGDGSNGSSAANPNHTYAAADTYNVTLTVTDDKGASATATTTATISEQVTCNPADPNTSINSTSQNGCPDGVLPERGKVPNTNYSVLAINDLGMHCGDLDTRIASILPPFQVLLAQVIQKGSQPAINPPGVSVYYSATSNPNDPILNSNVLDGMMASGETYKTNFWDFPVPAGTYDPFYPAYDPFNPAKTLTPLAGPPFNVGPDVGLPVPNVEEMYIGADGQVNSGDESLTAVTHAMPGTAAPYTANAPKLAQEHYTDKPFFVDFPFGYVAADVNWYEGAGIPFAAFDDNGRENAYPLVRVEARNSGGTTLSTVDTVLPISGEASCVNCHADPSDLTSVNGTTSRSTDPTDTLTNAGLPVETSLSDPDGNMPPRVSLEYAADINTLRLHDFKHGAKYVTPTGNSTVAPAPCDISANAGDGDANCLTNKALVQGEPVVCQVCHYTPALDLAHLGPLTGPAGSIANGRNHLHHKSNSNVMHSHHGSLGVFPAIPAPIQSADGTITNQAARLNALENSCYQCHPGTNVQCLRGAMFNGGMLCSDCHGTMAQVGNDFTADVTVNNPGPDAWVLDGNFYTDSAQPRVPWANEPGCGSCHTGDANTTMAGDAGTVVNTADTNGNTDGIRLRQAYLTGNSKATPIVPTDKRFAEPAVPASFNGFANPGAGNPQLYRVSTGHGGVMCEGCHGATHAEWPNGNPSANDNLAATQLQGHTGTIVECTTCHGSAMTNALTLGGPHGMHPVGDNTAFADGGHDHVDRTGCSDCHGPGGRGTNAGTVLSVAKEDRDFRGMENGGLVAKGTPIGCSTCHN